MQNKFRQDDSVIYLYYLGKFLFGLRFFVPIWMLFGLKFIDLGGLALIESFTFLITVLVDIPSGALADVFGRKRIIILGLIISGLAHVFFGFSLTIWDYVLWSIITNIGQSFVAGSDVALLYDHMKERGESDKFIRTQSFATVAFRSGLIVASFLGGWLYNFFPALPFLLMGLFELSSVICWLFIKEPKLDSIKFSWNGYFNKMKSGISEIAKSKYLLPLTAFYVLIGGITFSSLFFFNYSYAMQLGFDANQQSLLFGSTAIAKALIILLIGIFAVKFKRKQIFSWFGILMVITYLPAAFAPLWLAIIIISIAETLAAARQALLDKFVNDEISSLHRATSLSSINMLVNLFYLILVGLGGSLANKYGTNVLYSIFGLISLFIVIPLTIKLNSSKKLAEKQS